MSYPVPSNEQARLKALSDYRLLETEQHHSYEDFLELASFISGAPIALVTLIDAEYQHYFAKRGIEGKGTPRQQAFCAYTITGSDVLIVPDALDDQRFAENPSVTSDPHVRFYAGAPLLDSFGHALGSLCVLDSKPGMLTATQQKALQALARQVMARFDLQLASTKLAAALEQVKTLHGLLPICAYCKNLRNEEGYWASVEHYISTQTDAQLSHGICPSCLRQHYPDMADEILGREPAQ